MPSEAVKVQYSLIRKPHHALVIRLQPGRKVRHEENALQMARHKRVSSGAAQASAQAGHSSARHRRRILIVLCCCRSFIVSQSTGCSQPELLERLYQHFAQPSRLGRLPRRRAGPSEDSENQVCPASWRPYLVSKAAIMHFAQPSRLGRLPRRCAGPSEDPRVRSAPPFVVLVLSASLR